jgi:DNA-binding GntR family transcriptional regulator
MFEHIDTIICPNISVMSANPRPPSPPVRRPRPDDLTRHLAEAIAAGRFPLGALLPTELELCAHYATSRHTVRAALKALQDAGLVSRRKNVGTRVESLRAVGSYRQSLASIEDLAQFGATHVRVVRRVRRVKADAALAAELECAVGSRWLCVSSLRMKSDDDATPIGWTDVYVIDAYADVGRLVRGSGGALISTLIEAQHGVAVARLRQEIEATVTPAGLDRELGVEPGSAAMKVVRRYFDAEGKAFEVSISIHPAGRFRFSMQLQRSHEQAAG